MFKFNNNKIIFILSVLFYLGGTTSVFAIDPAAFYVNKDHPSANDQNPGSEALPWKSIQHGVNQMSPGQRLYVRESTTPYFEPYRFYGTDIGGISINVSGTSTKKIYIEGYPGDKVVINQKRGMSIYKAEDGTLDVPADSKSLSGFYIHKGNHIVIKNFEITQCHGSCVMMNPGASNVGIVIENNHIHHAYGTDNIGGIRLDHTDDGIVRNNIIHDIYTNRRTNNIYTNEPYGFDSGIHGYEPGNCLIEHNVIYNVDRGIFSKSSDRDGLDSHTVRRNVFYHNSHSAFSMEVQGGGSPPALNAKFYENIVYDSIAGVTSDLYETNAQSTNIDIYNNTFHNLTNGVGLKGQVGIEIHSNIFSEIQGMNIGTVYPGATYANINKIDYIDNNLYFNGGGDWFLELYSPNEELIRSLASWQQAFTNSKLTVLSSNPDVNSIVGDPDFNNVAKNDFSVPASSLASQANQNGRNNNGIGAYGLGATVIGINNVVRPKAITDLRVK